MANTNKTPHDFPTEHKFWRVVRWARWLLIPYALAMVVTGFFAVVLAGYGLAHGSAESNAVFLGGVLLSVVLACIPPLALLSNSRAIWVRALQVIALLIMAAGVAAFATALYHTVLEPALLRSRFAAVTAPLKIESVVEAPYLLTLGDPSSQVGYIFTANLRLPKPIALDRVGRSVVESFSEVSVFADKSGVSFVEDTRDDAVTFEGKSVDAQPFMVAYKKLRYDEVPNGSETIPAGVYTVKKTFRLNGVGRRWPDLPASDPANALPCRVVYPPGDKHKIYLDGALAGLSNVPLQLRWGTRFSLGGRRGYAYFGTTAPLQTRYDNAAWQAALAALPLESCQVFADQKAAKVAEEAAAKTKRDYDRGTIPMSENPLHQEACAGETDKIGARIAAEKPADAPWVPRFALSGIIAECSIEKPQLEVFKLLMPALKHRMDASYEAEGYCAILQMLHERRNLPYLKAAQQLALPLDCGDKGLWRAGLYPVAPASADSSNSYQREVRLREGLRRADFTEWLRFVIAQKIDVCTPAMVKPSYNEAPVKGKTVLQEIIAHAPLDAIEALLAAGCSPNETVNAVLTQLHFGQEEVLLPASIWWIFRRYRLDGEDATSPVDTLNKALLAKLDKQLAPSIDALESPFAGTQKFRSNVLLVAQRRITEHRNPNLIAAFANAGARMDTASTNGSSWYSPSLGTRWEDHNSPALNKLSNAQLKQLITPKIIGTDEPGKPQLALEKPTVNGLTAPMRTLVCERGVMRCN